MWTTRAMLKMELNVVYVFKFIRYQTQRLETQSITHFSGFLSGLTVKTFKNISAIRQLECSSRTLHYDVTLFGMTLFVFREGRNDIIVSWNTKGNECSTSIQYSACVAVGRDSRHTRLVSILPDYYDDVSTMYGCNVTGFRASHPYLVTWSLRVYNRKSVSLPRASILV